MVTRQLICEGACNGGAVQEFDSLIKEAGRTDTISIRTGEVVTATLAHPAVLKMGRNLKHTPHRLVSALQQAVCVPCGSIRRFIS